MAMHAAYPSTTTCRLTARRTILLAFLALGGIAGMLGGVAVSSIAMLGRLTEQTDNGALTSISHAHSASAAFAVIEAAILRSSADPARSNTNGRIATLIQRLADDLTIARARALSDGAAQSALDSGAAVAAWRAAVDAGAGPRNVDALPQSVRDGLNTLVDHAANDGLRFRERAKAWADQARLIAMFATIAALLLGGGIAFLLARRIMGPVATAAAAAQRIARGELDTPIPVGGTDELGALLAALATIRDTIAAMMARDVAQRRSAAADLTNAIEGSSEGVMVVDAAGAVAIANTRMAQYFPVLRVASAHHVPFAAIAGRTPELAMLLSADAPAHDVGLPGGTWLRISRSSTGDGGFLAICSDITTRKQHEAALQLSNIWLNAALNDMAQGLCMFGAQDNLRLVNRRYCELFGLQADAPRSGMRFRDLLTLCVDAGALAPDVADRTFEQRSAQIALSQPTSHMLELGQGRMVSIVHQPTTDGGWVATYDDVTDRIQAEAKLRHMARHDALTGLPNRVVLRETMDAAVAGLDRGGSFALLFIDLDNFKAVNDTLGFPAGDLVLQEVADRLICCLRKSETVARLGADEFAVLVPGLHRPEDAGDVATRIAAAVSAPYAVGDAQVVLGISIGIAMAPADGGSSDALLRKADLAMARAKLDGRGTACFFEPGMDARQQARRTMETDLRAGIGRQEFELLYQPLFDLREDRVCGFEALIRWNHPDGRISPAAFIPVAEDTGLIVPIGEWVMIAACREAAGWPDDVKVAVNVSPVQFRSPALVAAVEDALMKSGLAPSRLELEITESVLMANNDATLATLHRLRALGVRISMDDFGTGFSSLSYLRSFPFDKIKIDQSFIRDLVAADGGGGNALAIVRAIAGLGASLGMRTTAEGVETQEQLDRVRREGCTEVQGYFLGRPAPAAEVAGQIGRHAPRRLVVPA